MSGQMITAAPLIGKSTLWYLSRSTGFVLLGLFTVTVVLGLLTTKHGRLEDAAAVEARIHEAAAYVPLERLTLSPQCGFASVEAGNPLTPEEQEAKLRLVVQIARRVWG